jgi:tetratricopeptide (TPR) repeat protein
MRLFGFLLTTAILSGQHAHVLPTEKPVILLDRLGNTSLPIATTSPEAQQFFNQGVAMLYGFNRYEGLRSFWRASELDPSALMPYVFAAFAQGPHINMDLDGDFNQKSYCMTLDEARPLKAKAPRREQAWFDAAASRCPKNPDVRKKNDTVAIAAFKRLSDQYPDDLDALTFYADSLMIPVRWRWFLQNGQPNVGAEQAIGALETVLRREPRHLGANHFYIHAVESSAHPERAVPSAERLMGLAPALGHIVHMPGHIWMVLGDYRQVLSTNGPAVKADRDYFEKSGLFGHTYTGYFIHNLHFIAVARQMQGASNMALEAANEVAKEVSPMLRTSEGANMADMFLGLPFYAMLRFNRWDDILAVAAPDAKAVVTLSVWHFGRALAYQAKGSSAEAQTERKAFLASLSKIPANWIMGNNKPSVVLAVFSEALEARLAGSEQAAVPHWRRAVLLQDQLVYDEPPPFYYPVRESFGASLLRAGRAADAEAVFREGLVKSPRNGRLLFGLRESLKAQGKAESAALVDTEFQRAWQDADVELNLLAL